MSVLTFGPGNAGGRARAVGPKAFVCMTRAVIGGKDGPPTVL